MNEPLPPVEHEANACPDPILWDFLKPAIFAVACVFTLVGLFYAVENWRGKHAWIQYRNQLQAQGQNLDWAPFIPPPVPDEQNIFAAPNMEEWFVKGPVNELARQLTSELSGVIPQQKSAHGVVLAELEVVSDGSGSTNDSIFRFDEPDSQANAEEWLASALGPSATGCQNNLPFFARPIDPMPPPRLLLQSRQPLDAKDLARLFADPESLPGELVPSPPGGFQFRPLGSNLFEVFLTTSAYSAADYLSRSDDLERYFDLMREAVKRPYARMDGNYAQAFEAPTPNYVMLRTVAQTLAQRAQAHLLLGQPEAALHDLTLVHDLCRLLEAKPTGKPMLLVAAMIHVAITGLYASMVADGLRLHAWREPELAAMQKQLEGINLLPFFVEAMRSEQAGVVHLCEATPPMELAKVFSSGASKQSLWEMIKEGTPALIALAPRGWIYQNMKTVAMLDQKGFEMVNLDRGLVLPRQADRVGQEIQNELSRVSPFNLLAAVAIPNFPRATQTLARNQTIVNEALVACALERYRLALGQYPETLAALTPKFLEELPHDAISGGPLKYHRTEPGSFVLYSVGWNERDEGGIPGKTNLDGDWVWRYRQTPQH